jgi:hypothetical protein
LKGAGTEYRGSFFAVFSPMDTRGDIFPVAEPDVTHLDSFMWETDSPFERRLTLTADGGVEIVAKGRSAVTLAVWLQEPIAREKQL